MFGLFKNVKLQLNIALDRQVYAPGDTIHARITLQNDKEMNIQGGRFIVFCRKKYQYRHKHRDSDGDTTIETTWGTRDSEEFHFDFLPQMPLPPDTHTFDTSFTLPTSALPTSKGDILNTTWFAKATIDRKLAADTNCEIPFTVTTINPPNMSTATAGQYGISNEPGEAQMILMLKTKEITGGCALAGTLKIQPQKDIGVSEIRLELVREEYVADVTSSGYDHKKEIKIAEAKVSGKTQLRSGDYLEYPFALALPQALPPSMQFEVGSLRYKIKGILARSMRKDTFIEEEIQVFAG